MYDLSEGTLFYGYGCGRKKRERGGWRVAAPMHVWITNDLSCDKGRQRTEMADDWSGRWRWFV